MDFEKEKYNLRNNFPEYTFDYLPTLITDDVWDYYLDLYEEPLRLKTQWNNWLECASEFDSMDDLFKEKHEIKDKIQKDFDFISIPSPESIPVKYPRTDRFTMDDGRYFSIDLCEAMMRLYNRRGFTNCKTWSELIEKYTQKKFFKCKPARITIHHAIMKYWTKLGYTLEDEFNECTHDILRILETQDETILWLKEHGIKFSYVMGDNLLFKIPNEQLYELCLTKLQQEYIIKNDYKVHLDIIEKKTFVLNNSFLFCLYKSSLSNKTLVISTNEDVTLYYPQIYKQLYYNEPIVQEDLLYGMGHQTKKFNEKAHIKPFKL
jgi:hypothetical protein